MTPQLWTALVGRTLSAALCFALLAVLGLLAVPGTPDYPDATVRFRAETVDGRHVPRTEWINKALEDRSGNL